VNLPRQCVFLVGGLGTRLGDLAGGGPKPLAPVAGRPFLEWLFDKAAAEGCRDILLLAGHRAEALDAYVNVGRWRDAALRISIEPQPLGTAGALVNALPMLDETFLLLNGDTWFGFDWGRLTGTQGLDLVMALRAVSPADRYETVALDGDVVTAIRPRDPGLGEGLINGGVYLMRRAVLEGLTAPASLEADLLPRLCAQGRLGGRVCEGDFIDIGVPDSFHAAQAMTFG
jgi:NDP-sugar pyrophosphorylase family protein